MSNNEQLTPRQQRIATFIAALGRLDAGGRARLRRNAGRTLGEAHDVHRVFFGALPFEVSEWQQEDYFLVATLFPLAPHHEQAGSLGATLRQVRQGRGGANRSISLERRFQTLINCEREQLPFRLRQAVRLVAADGLGINWALLLRDLMDWNRDGKPVQFHWARDYWSTQTGPNQDDRSLKGTQS